MFILRRLIVMAAAGLLLSACAAPADTPANADTQPPLNATEFLATRVPQVMTEIAATQAAIPTATATPTLPATATPTITPTPEDTPTPSPSPWPTVSLSKFPAPPPAFGGEPHFYLRRPVGEGGNVFVVASYRYGSTNNYRFEAHHGVEFANGGGVPLVAAAPGVVYYAGNDVTNKFGPFSSFYGNLVVLELERPWLGRKVYLLYGHMERVLVNTGQPVAEGDLVGTVGASGIALGPHLHFEVRLDRPEDYWETRNPELWLQPGAGTGAVAVRVTNEQGRYLPGMRVGFMCSDHAYRYLDTYWDAGVNPDDVYGENAAMTDVPAGLCEFQTRYEGKTLVQTAVVEPGGLTFVWLRP